MWDRLWGEQDMRFLESQKHVEILICFKSWADKFMSLLVLDVWLPPSFNAFRILDLAASTFLRWRRLFILYVSIHDVGKHGCFVFGGNDWNFCFQNDRTKSNLLLSRNSQYTRPNIDEFIILTFKNECRLMLFASDKTSHTNSNTCMRWLQHYFVDLDFNCLDVGHVWPFLNNPQVSPPHSFPTALNCKKIWGNVAANTFIWVLFVKLIRRILDVHNT